MHDSMNYFFVLHLESQQPPAGYDAVVGEPGGDLNYDECIGTCKTASERMPKHADTVTVYNVSGRYIFADTGFVKRHRKNDAIRASYLIVYE
jgi:hypothetical protein